MTLGKWKFTPHLWPTLGMVVLVVGFCWLANWQWHRAGEKRALIASIEQGAHAPPIDLNRAVRDHTAVARFRRVALRGRYDVDHQVLINEIVHDSRRGYYVLTPFHLAGTDSWIMVNRGWIPASAGKTVRLAADSGVQTVAGLWTRLPEPGLRLGSNAPMPKGWPKTLFYPTRAQLADVLKRRVIAGSVWLGADQPDGFARDWHPRPRFGPGRHLGYMATWLGLAVTVFVTWLFLNWHALEHEAHE
ncbi:MAG TPA: SURF1 family protein [Gammaproteobacteria bacterium]|nr:SURF1 family protein [Gammaproteobacteria bacterium]